MITLDECQLEAIEKLESGKVLKGGTGSGKSLTSIAWYYEKVFKKDRTPLYIITTAKKRDDKEWEKEVNNYKTNFNITDYFLVIVDSWNNIKKYITVKDSVFIFDEQRLVGSGVWVRSFYKIAKNNKWILLTATPGDSFKDYIPLFVANGYYKNKTEFESKHVEWDRFSKFPKYKKMHNTAKLVKIQKQIIVNMDYKKSTKQIHKYIKCDYDNMLETQVKKTRFDPYKNEPIQQISGLCYVLRRVSNSNEDRLVKTIDIFNKHKKMIVFYNFDYELEALRTLFNKNNITYSEWNGKKHQPIPKTDEWVYLVQYAANEGWNCTSCNTILFFSLNYSYKVMLQASGRIDRRNTKYENLYYYHLYSNSLIDSSILQSNRKKKTFNEKLFGEKYEL